MSNTASDDKAITDWEHMSHTIAWVNNSAWEISLADVFVLRIRPADLSVESEGSLDTDEETLNIEGLEHDFCHLLSVLWRIHGRFCQDKAMLFWLTAEVRVDSSVPELFHGFPVVDLSASQNSLDIMSLLMSEGFISDVEV